VTDVAPPEHFDPDLLMRSLLEARVRFVLIGGFAVGVHGVVRATRDLDVVPAPDPDNLARLAELIVRLEGRQIGVDTDHLPHQPTDASGLQAGGSFQVATVHGQLDILQQSDTVPPFETLAAEAIGIEWQGMEVNVCSLGHLREMKRRAGRPLDLHDLEQLDATHPGS